MFGDYFESGVDFGVDFGILETVESIRVEGTLFIWCLKRCLYNLIHLLTRVVHSVEDGRLFIRSFSNISVQTLLTKGVFSGQYVRFQLMHLVSGDGWLLIRSLSSIVVRRFC